MESLYSNYQHIALASIADRARQARRMEHNFWHSRKGRKERKVGLAKVKYMPITNEGKERTQRERIDFPLMSIGGVFF